MGSTGEADRKRRHLTSISATAAAAKKNPLVPLSEEKKLDAAVLQFQNQKLTQKLETQKVEINAHEERLFQLNNKQRSYEKTLSVVNNSWEELVDELEIRSNRPTEFLKYRQGGECQTVQEEGESSPEDALLSRLLEKGATESSSTYTAATSIEKDRHNPTETDRQGNGGKPKRAKNILHNVFSSFHDMNDLKSRLYAASLLSHSSNAQSQKMVSSDMQTEAKNLRVAVLKLHLKHKSLAGELQSCRDTDAKNKAELRRLRGELESTIAELEESNSNLAILKTARDVAKGTLFPVLNRGNKQVNGEKARDKQQDLQDLEATLKELVDQSTSRVHELKHLHEDGLEILRQFSTLQTKLKNFKSIPASQAYVLLKDQLAKTKADVVHYQALYEKLQVEKESIFWREKESHMKNDLVDVLHRSSTVVDSRTSDLETEIQRYLKEKDLIETKLKEASKEPGRKEIIAESKEIVSSFPEKMGKMQNQLAKHKEAAADIHCLRADVQSLTNIIDRKVKELEALTSTSARQNAEIQNLQAMVRNLKTNEKDLKLFLEMFGCESVDSREVREARKSEITAWTDVQSLKLSLDEHTLESQVKAAIEAEAKAQQRLAATEAEIAQLRKNLNASKREKSGLSDTLKSKHEESEAYLAEIETIGQAYDDLQTQNQQLLQQITERDDYNIKLVLEGVQSRQTEDALLMDKQMLEKAVQQAKMTIDFYEFKAGRIEDQLKGYSNHIHRLAEDRVNNNTAGENIQRRLSDVRKSSQTLMGALEAAQSKVDGSRECLAELQIELETERFERKRVEEDVETVRRKAQHLKSEAEGSSTVQKLKQELKEYKEILKCSVCLDRRKEVVITKCYHLFCNPCVQNMVGTRHRKCPVCATAFGVNDVKPIYI